MITTEGTLHVKRYMAGWVPSIALSMAFGVGSQAEAAGDTKLQFEVGRSDVELVSYDFINDKLVFKATLDEGFDATLYEVGLYSLEANAAAGEYGSRLLTSFDSDTEVWMQGGVLATYDTSNARVGINSVKLEASTSTSVTATQSGIVVDLSGYSAADELVFAFHSETSHTASVRYRFLTDASNYYDLTVPAASITTGFNVVRMLKGAAVGTGTPNWGSITQLEVTATAKNTGQAKVYLEGIRIEDNDTVSPAYVMVARTTLAIPFDKLAGRIQEVEFPLGVTVNGA